MKSPAKFFRRNKKNQSLLADIDVVKPSYYEAMAEIDEDKNEIDARDEAPNDPAFQPMPYQLTTTNDNDMNMDAAENDRRQTSFDKEAIDFKFSEQFTEQISFQDDVWDVETMKQKKEAEEESDQCKEEKKKKQIVMKDDVWDVETMKQKKEVEEESDQCKEENKKKKIVMEDSDSDSDGIFDDLESVFEEIEDDDKFLTDFMANNSDSENESKTDMKMSAGELSGSDDPFTMTSPVSAEHLNKISKGILIVDPNKNGAVYHLDEDNKSLTDKDLLIIGHKSKGESDDQDDSTIMSSLTEVTYQKSKEERVKMIIQHLQKATKIPESNPFCSLFECGLLNHATDIDDIGNENDNVHETKMKQAIATTEGQFSLTQDTGALFQSIIGAKVDYGSFNEKIIVCITRIYLALVECGNDNGLRCTYNEPKLSHDLGVRLLEDNDGHAVVATVIPESTAERAGVQIGDKLSFAVPLNNTFQGYERACDFISRLELIGMRTSYRELFEMFLSKTSAGWPVAIVFRRQSEGMLKMKRMPFGLPSMDMSVDLIRGASCFHDLVTCSRELDYTLESNGIDEIIRGNIESFMPRPRCHDEQMNSDMQLEPRFFRIPFVPSITNNRSITHTLMFSSNFRRSSILSWYAENSKVMLYMRITNNKAGSGFIVARTDGGWSAPCAISGSLPRGNFQYTEDVDCIIFWKNLEHIQNFIKDKVITINLEDNLSNTMAMTKTAGSFYVETQMNCIIHMREDMNQMMYSKVKDLDIDKLFEGKISQPDDSTSLFGAIRRLELPSTMYPHPTPSINLSRYTQNVWERKSSCEPSDMLEHPFDEEGKITLRSYLRLLERGSKSYIDDKIEMDSFMLNFNRMLFDGVTVERITIKENNIIVLKKSLMKLWHLSKDSWDNATFQFTTRGNSRFNDEYRNLADFRYPLQNSEIIAESFKVNNIISISKTIPGSMPLSEPQVSETEKKKRKKRFVLLEMNDGTQIMFYARTGKDASLLSCGLKLLIERVQINI